ncbi:hypothetical protein ACNR9Q_15665 [Maribacter sp. X9]|uniref:hypothetical protein n=1 Tax=Maribacter sp. X9 TaxID=3402159 RepID=UPI003AF402D2
MKKLNLLLGALVAVFFISCEGPEGPPGPPGFDGADGDLIIGETYEIDNVDFSVNNNSFRYQFPQNLVNGDAVLVYRLEKIEDGLDVWEPLPTATIFFDDGGFLQYRFNYTTGDVDIIIESDDLSLIGDDYLINQVFRVIVMPSDLISSMDTSNFNAVIKELGLKQENIEILQLK